MNCLNLVETKERLKPNASNNKARRIKFHRYVLQFLPRDHGGFGHKNQKMSDFLGIAQKVRHFIILVPKTAMRCLTCRKTSQSQKMKNRFLNLF